MEFYYTPDTCALASLIVMEELGVEYRLNRIDFGAEQQKSADYLRVNPKARVPALVAGGVVLTETPALLVYLAQEFRGEHLLLDGPLGFARLQAVNSYLCSTLHVAHAHRMRGYRWADDPAAHDAMRAKVPEAMSACWSYVETEIMSDAYVFDHFTVADAYVFTMAQWMEADGVDPEEFPKVSAHREMMRQRPAVARCLEIERA